MKINILLLLTALLMASLSRAQEFIPLSDAEVARLGIVFAPVSGPDQQSGSHFPATVISSPEAVSDVVIPFAGIISRWYVAPGDSVDAEQVLVEIRSQELLELQQAWLTARTGLEMAEHEAERDQTLFAKGVIARRRLQESEHILQQAQIRLNSLGSLLALAGFDRQSLWELETSPDLMGSYSLHSPADGVLARQNFSVGQHISQYQVAAILGGRSHTRLWIQASIPARLASALEVNSKLNVVGVASPVTTRHRELKVDETTQTLTLLAEFVDSVNLVPGQVVSLILPPLKKGPLVPASAVVHSGGNTIVYLRSPGGVEAREVSLEAAGSNYIAGPGVQLGDQLVIQGAAILKGIQLGLGQAE